MNDAYSVYNPSYRTGDFPDPMRISPPLPKWPNNGWWYVTAPPSQFAPWCGGCGHYKFDCRCNRFEAPEPRPLRPEDV